MSSVKIPGLVAALLFVICMLSTVSGEPEMQETQILAETDLQSMEEAQQAFLQLFEKANGTNGCWCSKYTCQCCRRIYLPRRGICTTASFSVTLVSRWNIRVTFRIAGRVVIYGTIPAQYSRNIYRNVRFVKRCASILVQVYNTRVCGNQASGCVWFQLRLGSTTVSSFLFGCYRMSCVDSGVSKETPFPLPSISFDTPAETDELSYIEGDEDVPFMSEMEQPLSADNAQM